VLSDHRGTAEFAVQQRIRRKFCDFLIGIVCREMVRSERKCCQGCRAKISFEKNPWLIGVFLDFWCRTGNFPESESWLAVVPQKQFNLWAK
jgi:hypothetical protein